MTRMLDPGEIMAILRTTVDRFGDLTAGAPAHELRPVPFDAEWTIAAVLAHLRACNDVLGGNMVRIVTEDQPSWRGVSPRTWQRKSGYHDWQFGPAFEAFADARTGLLEVLEPLAPAAWERTATVAVPPKKTYEYSVRYYGDWLAAHERAHLGHLRRKHDQARRSP